jgi:hypothetical protein
MEREREREMDRERSIYARQTHWGGALSRSISTPASSALAGYTQLDLNAIHRAAASVRADRLDRPDRPVRLERLALAERAGAPTLYSPAEPEQPFAALEDSCVVAALKGAGAGFLGGSLLGAVFSNWSDSPLAVHNQRALPALQKTGALMVQHGSTLGAVGLAYASVECASRSVRGKHDVLNGVLGGVAAGAVLGARSGNLRAGAVGMIVLGAVSAATDASGWQLTGQAVDGVRDRNSPVRTVFPYSAD